MSTPQNAAHDAAGAPDEPISTRQRHRGVREKVAAITSTTPRNYSTSSSVCL
jgi:hypothetical protein